MAPLGTGRAERRRKVNAPGFIAAAGELLFPPRCCACRAFSRDLLCEKCARDVKRITGPLCPACGHPQRPGAGGRSDCGACRGTKPRFDSSVSAVDYSGPVAAIVKKFKFPPYKRPYGGRLAALMLERFRAEPEPRFSAGADFIAPVPLHPLKFIRRGFNQAEVLALEIALEMELPVINALRRVRNTRSQSKLKFKERAVNVRGAFAVRRGAEVDGASVVLVDDVFTSGATVDECAGALKEAGAAKVHVFTAARACLF